MNSLPELSMISPLPPASYRLYQWKCHRWMLAVFAPSALLMGAGVFSLGFVQIQGLALGLAFCAVVVFSILLVHSFWRPIQRRAEEWEAFKVETGAQTTADEQRREQERREGITQKYLKRGMTAFDLSSVPLPSGNMPADVDVTASAILDAGLLHHLRDILDSAAQARSTRSLAPMLVSLALPSALVGQLRVDSKFLRALSQRLRFAALESLSPAESVGVDAQVRERFDAAVRLETWMLVDEALESQDHDLGFLIKKQLMAPDELVHYTVQSRHEGEWLQVAQFPTDKPAVKEPRRVLLLPESASLTALAKERHCAAADILLPDTKAEVQMELHDLHQDRPWQKALGVKVQRHDSPFPLLDTYTSRFKGSITCVGWWDSEGWHRLDRPVQSRLSASSPNQFKKGVYESSLTTDEEELGSGHVNLLLRELLSLQEQDFSRAIAQDGNFTLMRGPKQEGSSVFKYFIKVEKEAETITRILRVSGSLSHQSCQDRERYEDLGTALRTQASAPLEQKGFFRLPFSEGYLLTGGDSLQLCLRLDLGSPSLGEDANPFIHDEVTLPASLAGFARLNGIPETHYELLPHAAQGLTARVTDSSGNKSYLKLLEAAHTRNYRTLDIVKQLQTACIVPEGIRYQRINSQGQPSAHGQLYVFSTSACRSAADAIVQEQPDMRQRLLLWMEMNRFLLRLREKGLACTDITLRDLMHDASSLAEKLEQPRSDTAPGFFVVDYGSYIRHADFRRELSIVKEEMCAPEDRDHRLPYEPEAYQVFLQGILAVQILLADPGYVPAAIQRQIAEISLAEMHTDLWEELTPRLSPLLEGNPDADTILKTLRGMLHHDPTRRPTLREIAE